MQTLQEKYRYNPFLQYGNELETIISEKEYDADVADMLRLSFPIMVEYYGHEYKDILFDALRKISIEIPKIPLVKQTYLVQRYEQGLNDYKRKIVRAQQEWQRVRDDVEKNLF